MKLFLGKSRTKGVSPLLQQGEGHVERATVLDHQRPAVQTAFVSGVLDPRPVQRQPSFPVRLLVVRGRALVDDVLLRQSTIGIGRDETQDIVLDDVAVSRAHCQIRYEDGSYAVYDLGTANGMTVNGHATPAELLAEGDEIGVGHYVVIFQPSAAQLRRIDYRRAPGYRDERRIRETQHLSGDQIAEIRKAIWEVRSPHLRILGHTRDSGRLYVLGSRSVLGRGPHADVPLSGWFIAERHAEIVREPHRFIIRAVSRRRAVYVNGRPIRGDARTLENRDIIAVAKNLLRFGA